MNTPIICAGFHRSGTSLASQILHNAGLPYAIEDMAGNISNPDGHFEDLFAMRMHDEFLSNMGTSWQYHGEVGLSISSDTYERIKRYCALRASLHGANWLMKDPRATIFLDQWKEALNGKGRFVLLYRHWSLCIQSLYKRHSQDLAYNLPVGQPFNQSISFWKQSDLAAGMWLAYNKALTKFVRENPDSTILVSQASLVNGFDIIEEVNRKFQLDLPPIDQSTVKQEYYESSVDERVLNGLSDSLISEMNNAYSELHGLSVGEGSIETPKFVEMDPSFKQRTNTLIFSMNQYKENAVDSKSEVAKGLIIDDLEYLSYSEILALLKKLAPNNSKETLSKAELLAKRLIAIDPFKYLSQEWAGRIKLRSGNLIEAEVCFLKAISMEGSPHYLKMMLAQVYINTFDFSAAEYYLKLAYKGNPKNPSFSIALGDIYFFKDRLEESIHWYRKSIEIEKSQFGIIKLSKAIEKLTGPNSAIDLIKAESEGMDGVDLRRRIISLMLSARHKDASSYYKNCVKSEITKDRFNSFIKRVADIGFSRSEHDEFFYWILKSLSKVFSPEELDSLFSLPSFKIDFSSLASSNKERSFSKQVEDALAIDLDYSDLNVEAVAKMADQHVGGCLIKLCHGFWEQCVRFEVKARSKNISIEYESDDAIKLIESFNPNWPGSLYFELKRYLNSNWSGFYKLVSPFGWKNALSVEGTPYEGLKETVSAIKKNTVADNLYDGLIWKNAVSDGTIETFLSSIRYKDVILVAPDFAKGFAQLAGLKSEKYVQAHPTRAAWELDTLEKKVSDLLHESSYSIVLIEVGGVSSSVLACRLHKKFPKSLFLCLGQVLNIANLQKLSQTNWFQSDRKNISKTIFGLADKSKYSIFEDKDESLVANGIDPILYKTVFRSLEETKNSKGKLRFIENKLVNNNLIEKLNTISSNKNQWANFGPVTELLELAISNVMDLPDSLRVVATKSGTASINALVGLEEVKRKRKLKWVVSSFGFFSTGIGILADAKVIDCNPRGFLDEESLGRLNDEEWDGIVITNSFGLFNEEVERTIQYIKNKGKSFVIDNAVGMMPGNKLKISGQAISLHHTKPWGFGEGGCLIVDKNDYEVARSLINFNYKSVEQGDHHATNAKISDVEASYILQRLMTRDAWQRLYQMQQRRIRKLAISCGFSIIKQPMTDAVLPALPVLSNRVVSQEEVNKSFLPIRKYYKPLNSECHNAKYIYERILNVSCNPELCGIKDDVIVRELRKFL